MKKFLYYFTLTGIFIIPFIPLFVSNSLFFPFITGKNFAFRILVELILGGWVVLALLDRKYRPQRSWILWTLGAFVIIMAIADLQGVYRYKSIWSNFERMEGLVTLLHLAAYTLVLSLMLNTERLWSWFWNTTIGVSVIMSLYGIAQLAGWAVINQGGVRLDGRLGNAAYLAIYILFHIFLTAYIIVSERHFLGMPNYTLARTKKLIIGGAIIILETVILYFTATRGAMLGLVGGVFLAALLMVIFEKARPRLRKTAGGIVIAAIVVVLGFIAVRHTSFVQNSPVLTRFASISINDSTTLSRFKLWNMAFQGFKEKPILGWGQENFNYVFNKYYDPALYNQEQWFDRTHNVIFDWLIAGGLLGLLTYLAFFGAIIWYLWRRIDGVHTFSVAERSIITGMLFGYFIHNLFVFDNLTSYIMFFAVAAYVYVRTTPVRVHDNSVAPAYNRVAAPVALVVILALIYFVNIRPIQASVTLIHALTPHANAANPSASQIPFNGDITQNLADFKKVIGYNTFGSPEAREQLMTVSQQIAPAAANISGATEFVQYTIDQAKVQIARTPRDARYFTLFGNLLNSVGKFDDAVLVLKKAQELSPQKQAIIFETGIAYIEKKDFVNGEKEFKKAFDLDPNNKQARILYAASSIYAGHYPLATETLKPLSKAEIANTDFILQAYYITQQNNQVLEIWQERSAQHPNDPQTHLSLAAAYLLVKDRTHAIAEIQKVIDLAPEFKTQGEDYIKQIKAGKTL